MALIIGTKKIWDFWAPRYENLWAQRYSLGPGRKAIHRHIKEKGLNPVRILDIGCGVGQLAFELAQDWPMATVIAADYSAGMMQRARDSYQVHNISFIEGSLWETPASPPYDLIVSTHSFPYFPDKLLAAQKMYELLSPGGRLLIVQGNTNNFYDWLWMRFVKLTVSESEFLSVSSIRNILSRAGFTLGEVRSADTAWFIPSIYLVEGIKL
jgi:trans-aconitate methyltransferase